MSLTIPTPFFWVVTIPKWQLSFPPSRAPSVPGSIDKLATEGGRISGRNRSGFRWISDALLMIFIDLYMN